MNNIVDSSGWLEYFANTKRAKYFEKAIENAKKLIVPSITVYEVFKKVLKEKGETTALTIVAHMKRGKIIDLDLTIALLAAKLSHENNLPMADSIILATAQSTNSILWTQDSDFLSIQGVKYFQKSK